MEYYSALRRKDFPDGASGKEPACQCKRWRRHRFDPWVWKVPWRRAWKPVQYSCLESPMDGEEPGGLQSTGLQRVRHDEVTAPTQEGRKF